jgi:hypothetical protein
MKRDLPARPSLEHLKKQAKDLLDAHQRKDPAALARIRDAVPAFAGKGDDAIANAPFALHDAQSAVAREHGMKSWQELRDAVAAKIAREAPPAAGALPEELLRALVPMHFPEAVGAALGVAMARRASAADDEPAPLLGALPLVAMRDALLVRRAVAPIHVGRDASLAAVEAALARTPPTIAVFAQRVAEREEVGADDLFPVGCEALVHARVAEARRAWLVLEAVRWIALEGLEKAPEGYTLAQVAPVRIERGPAGEVEALAAALRATARDLARGFPGGATLVTRIDGLDAEPLADLVVGNLSVPVADKARFAEETRLVERLRMAHALATEQLQRRA